MDRSWFSRRRRRQGRAAGGDSPDFSPCNMQDGTTLTTQPTVWSRREAPPDLRVEMLASVSVHGDVAGEGVKQTQVSIRVVADLPIKVPHEGDLEEPARLDLLALVRQQSRAGPGRARR